MKYYVNLAIINAVTGLNIAFSFLDRDLVFHDK